MSEAKITPLVGMVDKLAQHGSISIEDRGLLSTLPFVSRVFEAGSYLVREGNASDHYYLLVSGLACRHKISGEGVRQIVSILTPSDLFNIQQLYFETADHNVQTLTRCEVLMIPRSALRQLVNDHPSVAHSLTATMLVELSMAREWILNIGRRDARTRLAHLLCELSFRLGHPDLPLGQSFDFSMTQEQIGDALGLTAVHINRTLKGLVGLVVYSNRRLTILDWQRLRDAGDFNSSYLHTPNLF